MKKSRHSLGKWDKVIDWIMGIGFVFGVVILFKTSIDINQFVIPNTGLTIKEATSMARQTVLSQIWVGCILAIAGWIYLIIFKR